MSASPRALVEAALFVAGRPLSLDELQRLTRLKRQEIIRLIEEIRGEIQEHLQALELAEVDGNYVIRVKPGLAEAVKGVSGERGLGRGVLKTLAFIYKNQPVAAKEVASRRGPAAYSHIKRLQKVGLIRKRPEDGKYEVSKYFYVLFNVGGEGVSPPETLGKATTKAPSVSSRSPA